MTTTVDLTFKWAAAVPMLLALLQHGTPEGKAKARDELQRMAKAADLWNDLCRQASTAQAEIQDMATRDPRLEAIARDIRREMGFDEGGQG